MNAFFPVILRLGQRSDLRLAAFGLSAVASVYLGFFGVSVTRAESLVEHGGYYVLLLAFALFLHSLWRAFRERRFAFENALTRRQLLVVIATVGVLSLFAIKAEPARSKILNDEFVLQSTAFNMHYFRDVAMVTRGYDIEGLFISTNNYLDKRPYFYPLLVSLVHDFTGYRLLNAYLVNMALMPAALALIFIFGRLLSGWRGGLLAVVLLGSLPLLGQNATGSGMELLNVVMILATMTLAVVYLRTPAEQTLTALVLAAVLLAQSRYESALYVLPVAVIVLCGWVRAGRVILTWQVILVPLLLVPYALQNKVLSNSPQMWELTDNATTRFSTVYFAKNAENAFHFLFSRSNELANSVLLSAVGIVALAWSFWQLITRWSAWRVLQPQVTALLLFGAAMLGNTLLVFCYYWSGFTDRMASRLSLPLHLVFAFTAVLLFSRIDRWWPATRIALAAGCLFFFGVTISKYASNLYSHVGIDEVEWERRFVNALPPGERIIITNKSTLPWLLEKKPSILMGRARVVADRLAYQLHEPTFREILVLQVARPTTLDGDFEIIPEDRLPPSFELELMIEKRFGARLARISRLRAVNLPAPAGSANEAIP